MTMTPFRGIRQSDPCPNGGSMRAAPAVLQSMGAISVLIASFAVVTGASASEIKRIVVNGTELAYVETGRGAPVILVHGGLQDYRLWRRHLDVLGQRYRVIAYSRRNHFPNEVSASG